MRPDISDHMRYGIKFVAANLQIVGKCGNSAFNFRYFVYYNFPQIHVLEITPPTEMCNCDTIQIIALCAQYQH